MMAMELLNFTNAIYSVQLSKNQLLILEADLFTRICDALKETFKPEFEEYFRIMKFTTIKEDEMMEEKLVGCIVRDILSTGEYTLKGIAYYTQTPEEVVYDIFSGLITNPSSALFRKIVKLHRSVRRDLYRTIFKKINLELE